MASQTLNFITWNVNGLKQSRDQKFQKFHNADVVFLQETHIGETDEHIKDYEDEWYIFYTKYSSSSKGTAILVRKTLKLKCISDEKDNSGAYVVLKCELAGQLYTLVSVYLHQTDTKTLDNLSRYLQSMTTGLLVIGGDFNTSLNPFIDKKWSTGKMTKNRTHNKLLLFVENFMQSLQLADVWRRKNPVKQDFTFYIKDCPVSRLDYFFIPDECMWRVRSCEIMNSKISELKDHRLVSLVISTVPLLKDLNTQSTFSLKKDLCEDLNLCDESSHAVSEIDIVLAVHSLQVSDTPRPDGIPVSFYKDNIWDVIPYIKKLYDRIYRSALNCSEKQFNETVRSPHDDTQHFFNVDYLIIATILARRLDNFLESLPRGQIPKNSATVMITPKIHYALISLSHIKDELEQQKQLNPILSLDLLIIEYLLSDANKNVSGEKYKQLHQGFPLTPGLMALALKSYASQLFGHLENYRVFTFKQSVIVHFLHKDDDTVEESTNEIFETVILSKGNGELLQLNCLESDPRDEEWEKLNKETFGKKEESTIYEGDESMEDDNDRSAISEEPKEEMEGFQRMKKNPPPLLPVSSQSTSSSDGLYIHPTTTSRGTKRKHDHELSDLSMDSSQKTDIIEHVKQILQRVTKTPDQMDKGRRKKAIIGIFGKSGEGKSSLLSAVLGKKDLLPSGCFGACTAVTTQVEANLEDSAYKAEIELFSKKEWEKELKDLFRDITADGEDKNDELIETAEEKITALYGADADKKTLEELKQDDKFAEIENFLSINTKTISNTDLSEFTNAVASYIQHSESSPGNWYWPLVKSVTIKIPDCHDLLEHIVLVDLPGTGDCNKTRNDLWKSKLRECSSVWIVSAINRAITDKDPWGILKHCIEELGLGGKCKSIKFICTKTDDINPAAYIRSARLQSVSPDQKNACILHRNEHAKAKVKEKFEKSEIKNIFSTDNHFQVFTVSSNAFFDYNLNLQTTETEIPQLQDDLRSLNKSINKELAHDFVNKAKGTLLLIQSGQMDTNKKMNKLKGKVRIEYENNLMKSLNELDKYFGSINDVLEQGLSRGVEQSVQKCVASTEELIAPKKDGRGFHKILSALCKNHGCYWSKNWDKILDLNKQLAKHLQACIDNDFRHIFPVSGKTGRSVQEQIDKFTIIQSDSAYFTSPILQPIQNYIQIEETKLKSSLNIVDMKKDIYSSIQTTIKNEMSRCYEEAASITGVGSMKRKQKLLITTVHQKKKEMSNKAKTEVLKKFQNFKLYIMADLESGLKKAIKRSLDQTSKSTWKDVSREIKELEILSELLID